MMQKLSRVTCLLTAALVLVNLALAQETDRSPFALELPELSTGRLVSAKVYVTRADVNVVKFWLFTPVADSVDWSKIKVRINNNAANRVCDMGSTSLGKVFKCDLNKIAGFRLSPRENRFEIEAEANDGKRYYASFLAITDPKQALSQPLEDGKKQSPRLGFSGRRYAVVIGVSKYAYNDVGLGNLSYADKDARSLRDWLIESGGFSVENILFMVNEQATLDAVRFSLNNFLTKATENDLVLFYFAGHGTPDPFNPAELYYLVHDSKVGDLKRTGFAMSELRTIIETRMRSKRAVFLLDTCHSAGISGRKVVPFKASSTRERGLDDGTAERILERPVEVKNSVSEAAGRLYSSTGRAVFTSSGVSETSREGTRWGGGHGVFTWALLEGLNGGADTNGDRTITSGELFAFVTKRVSEETGGRQKPTLFSALGEDLQLAVMR